MLDALFDALAFGRPGRPAAYLALVVAIGVVALVVTGEATATLLATGAGALVLGVFWHRCVGWGGR